MDIRFGAIHRVLPGSQEIPNVKVTLQKGNKKVEYNFKVDDTGRYGTGDLALLRNLQRSITPLFIPLHEVLKPYDARFSQIDSQVKKLIACYLAARAQDFKLLEEFTKSKTEQFTGYLLGDQDNSEQP